METVGYAKVKELRMLFLRKAVLGIPENGGKVKVTFPYCTNVLQKDLGNGDIQRFDVGSVDLETKKL